VALYLLYFQKILENHVPNQPNTADIPTLMVRNNGKHVNFGKEWFTQHPWLHYLESGKSVLCFTCATAYAKNLLNLANTKEHAFIVTGFKGWTKANERFKLHESSHTHRFATEQIEHTTKSLGVNAQVNRQQQQEQATNRECLRILMTSIRYLAAQGLALLGHEKQDSNLYNLLSLRAEDCKEIQAWLQKKRNYLDSSVQNEILTLFSNAIIREIVNKVKSISNIFSISVDGTKDISGIEQEAVCIRYVDENLLPQEDFLGFYECQQTTGESIARIIQDVLLRLGLPISNLRGQTYDGAANMSGAYSGCQARIAEIQPLAMYIHCGAHCGNLVAQAALNTQTSRELCTAMDVLQELSNLYNQSGKIKTKMSELLQEDLQHPASPKSLGKLCTTRWLTRVAAIKAVLLQYETTLKSLDELAESDASINTRASGLSEQLSEANTYIGLYLCQLIFQKMERLTGLLQTKSYTINDMNNLVDHIKSQLQDLRSEDFFHNEFEKCVQKCDSLGLDSAKIPRKRRPPSRFTGHGEAHVAETVEVYFRTQFYAAIDNLITQLTDRFNGKGLQTYQALEGVLITGNISEASEALLKKYNFDTEILRIELKHFHKKFSPVYYVCDVRNKLCGMTALVRELYANVEELCKLLLVCSPTSSEAERNFSKLRRIKTWLRSTMTATRLNALAVCHAHKEILDTLDIDAICKAFVCNERRQKHFGQYL
jgi:hypothetical protein